MNWNLMTASAQQGYENSWDFTMKNYNSVWAFLVQLGLLLLFLMLGNVLRTKIPWLRKCLIPSALLGGTLLLVVNIIVKQFGAAPLVDNRLMQVITYHCLAIGFAAMSLKREKSTHKTKGIQVVEFGALQGGTYMLQAFVGLGITILLFFITVCSSSAFLPCISSISAGILAFRVLLSVKNSPIKLPNITTTIAINIISIYCAIVN